MTVLTSSQVKEVKSFVKTFKRLRRREREELLDHICCDIEYNMSSGMLFGAALSNCKERWNEDEVQNIHSSPQTISMFKLIVACISVAVSTTAVLNWSIEPVTNQSVLSYESSMHSDYLIISPPSICPLEEAGMMTAGFGPLKHPITKKMHVHKGVDWKAPIGTAVLTAGDGVITKAEFDDKYGNHVIVTHDDSYQTVYAHLESMEVAVGERVIKGHRIGRVGSTGLSTGPHLHYEVIKDGEHVNPENYLP